MNLTQFFNQSIARLLKTAARFYLPSREGRAFLSDLTPALRDAADRRARHAAAGLPVPAFLIASVASRCNLRCAGCYARAGGACADAPDAAELDRDGWRRIFDQAEALGVSFVLLAGGEPLLRRDVLELAAAHSGMIFPVFTNGTLLDAEMLDWFAAHRNLLPVLSVEGDAYRTDARRGAGVSARINAGMQGLRERGLLYGASVTVTSENRQEVSHPDFVHTLRAGGCGLVFYVEYVPAEPGTEALALDDEAAAALRRDVLALKQRFSSTIVLHFPGDEEAMGGCLAAGRGFFHIAPTGDAEPCPFAPYATHNLRTDSLVDALRAPFFHEVRSLALVGGHRGGCALFAQQSQVQATRDDCRAAGA